MKSSITIGACDWALPGGGLYATQIAAEVGLQALSLKVGLYENDYPLTYPQMQKFYLKEQQTYGIEYCAIALNDFDNIPMHAIKGTKEYDIVWGLLRRAVPTAKALGAQVIQVPAFAASEMTTEAELIRSALALQYLCDEAGSYGISVASENLMPPVSFKALQRRVDRKNFYLYFDSQNYKLFRGYNQLHILEELYPSMCPQLHVKDGTSALSGSLLGTGSSSFFNTIDWLKEQEFTGYILLENYYDRLPLRLQAENPYELLREDIRILKKSL
ncbi:MAG: sugar phosphate isomerase/epimerase family protein [Lachnospiraceae bacterium]